MCLVLDFRPLFLPPSSLFLPPLPLFLPMFPVDANGSRNTTIAIVGANTAQQRAVAAKSPNFRRCPRRPNPAKGDTRALVTLPSGPGGGGGGGGGTTRGGGGGAGSAPPPTGSARALASAVVRAPATAVHFFASVGASGRSRSSTAARAGGRPDGGDDTPTAGAATRTSIQSAGRVGMAPAAAYLPLRRALPPPRRPTPSVRARYTMWQWWHSGGISLLGA